VTNLAQPQAEGGGGKRRKWINSFGGKTAASFSVAKGRGTARAVGFPARAEVSAQAGTSGYLSRPGATADRGGTPSHRRIGIPAAKREQAIRRSGDVEIKREMLAKGEHVAKVPLERVSHV
jgi:hypothetical protein